MTSHLNVRVAGKLLLQLLLLLFVDEVRVLLLELLQSHHVLLRLSHGHHVVEA